jgi:hypothetical protein
MMRRAHYPFVLESNSSETELVLEQQCDHDPKPVYRWCIDR